MEFSTASNVATRLIVLGEVGSTNDELAARVAAGSRSEWPEFTTLVSDQQSAGRGRLGRQWAAPPGTMLAISVLLRPSQAGVKSAEATSWIPLIAGLAMVRALASLGARTELKWPNDVLIEGRKVCGILAELQSGGSLILGAGVNLTLSEAQLPVATATSMLLEGCRTDPDAVLAAYLSELRGLYELFIAAGGDAEASGAGRQVTAACSTLGQVVHVQLPGHDDLIGRAEALDATGRLIVDSGGRLAAVSAGDITHLRY
jgi:BirA family biotin operon repressor/biotin-[acetyl-CoA-carboxylase] ligase